VGYTNLSTLTIKDKSYLRTGDTHIPDKVDIVDIGAEEALKRKSE